MSRVGKLPITVPDGVDIKIEKSEITVTKDGKSLFQEIHPAITMEYDVAQKQITIKRGTDNRFHRSLHGLYRTLINNMVVGVTDGYQKKLEIVGVGYRAELKGKNLFLSLGYSHPILFKVPDGIDISTPKLTNIVVNGIDKQLVGQVAAKIRSFRPPEPYKGKGIKYEGEYIRRKAGKTAA
ncbi:MAG: 50S ribosomal protein L6 [Bacteroidales bacterium]|nr:50S ribosomal protein L6 [Bacteroidales bacterium]